MKILAALLAAATLAGCAMLTAETTLFTPADQDGVFVLSQGLWAHREDDCKIDPATSAPERNDCIDWVRVTREADGAWRIVFIGEDDPPMRFVAVPAAKGDGEALAPLYVAEVTSPKEEGPAYAALAPRGALRTPVTRVAMTVISCGPILRDGAMADITVQRDGDRIVGCTALTKDAVREAARRAVIADLARFGESELVWVR
ncbi:MAG: hypothetical protein SGJ23_17655 [Alphaproteobacteria bacterium]|nr:hypothetical protein [Alphaproteobacteria bacterium]